MESSLKTEQEWTPTDEEEDGYGIRDKSGNSVIKFLTFRQCETIYSAHNAALKKGCMTKDEEIARLHEEIAAERSNLTIVLLHSTKLERELTAESDKRAADRGMFKAIKEAILDQLNNFSQQLLSAQAATEDAFKSEDDHPSLHKLREIDPSLLHKHDADLRAQWDKELPEVRKPMVEALLDARKWLMTARCTTDSKIIRKIDALTTVDQTHTETHEDK